MITKIMEVNIPDTIDIDKIIRMVSEEMSLHKSIEESAIHAATSTIISPNLKDDIMCLATEEAELFNAWKDLHYILTNAEFSAIDISAIDVPSFSNSNSN